MQRILSHCTLAGKIVFASLALLFVLLASAFLWLSSAPRPINNFIPDIQAAVNNSQTHVRVKIGEAALYWEDFTNPFQIQLKDVWIYSATTKAPIARLPVIRSGLNIWRLPLGDIQLASITLNKPIVRFYIKPDGELVFSLDTLQKDGQKKRALQQSKKNDVQPSAEQPFGQVPLTKLHLKDLMQATGDIIIRDAKIPVFDYNNNLLTSANNAQLVITTTEDDIVDITLNANMEQPGFDTQAHITMHATQHPEKHELEGVADISGFYSMAFYPLLSFLTDLPDFSLTSLVSGNIAFTLNTQSLESAITYSLEVGEGTLQAPLFEKEVPIKQVIAQGVLQNKTFTIKQFEADIDGPHINMNGHVALTEQGMDINLSGGIASMPLNTAKYLWPVGAATESRQWLIDNLHDGVISSGKVNVRITPEQFNLPALPAESINASLAFSGSKVRYMDDHPMVMNASGKMETTADMLTVYIDSADYLTGTKLSKGKVDVKELMADNPRIEVAFHAAAPANDIVTFMQKPPAEYAEILNLSPEKAKGSFNGDVSIGFYYDVPRDEEGDPIIDLSIKTEVMQFSHPGFLKRFDIAEAIGTLSIDNKKLIFKGNGKVNSADATIALTQDLDGSSEFETILDIKARASSTALARMGYPGGEYTEGMLSVDAVVKQNDAVELTDATIVLDDAEIIIPEINWTKPQGEKATLTLSIEEKNNVLALNTIQLKGENNTNIVGTLEASSDFSTIVRANFSPVRVGTQDIVSLTFGRTQSDDSFSLEANTVDLSMLSLDEGDNTGFSFADLEDVSVKANILKLITSNTLVVNNVDIGIECKKICTRLEGRGTLEDNSIVSMQLKRNQAGVRTFAANASNAGSILQALDIYDTMKNGKLEISGSFNDTVSGSPFSGTMTILDFEIVRAPVLAKLLSLASLTGIFDTLQGNGITFTKLATRYLIQGDAIQLDHAKMIGSSIGLTSAGNIDLAKEQVNLDGVVVPTYMVNSVLGNIPILGNLITGGEDEGVFAARYSMKGKLEDPEISVNPLSILTPGFLRGLFDVFDEKEVSDDAAKEVQEEQEELGNIPQEDDPNSKPKPKPNPNPKPAGSEALAPKKTSP